MRRIKEITVLYDDDTLDTWVGNGTVVVSDTVSPGPPMASVSFVTALLSIPARLELNAGGMFTGKRLPAPHRGPGRPGPGRVRL